MGLVNVEIEFKNPKKTASPIIKEGMADTGALHLCIPQDLADELELDVLKKRLVKVADGTSHKVDYVGPLLLKVCGRECFTGALVMGDQILLGAVPMEDMDLWVSPARHKVVTNPASPEMPLSVAMGHQTVS